MMTATATPARARRSPGKNVAVAVALSESATGKMQQRLCVDWPARLRFGSSAQLQQFSWARGGGRARSALYRHLRKLALSGAERILRNESIS